MKIKVECVEGIILSDVNYSESSKILNILTKEFGLIGVMSKGCRNMKSKLRGVSRKLIYGKFHIYYKVDGLCTLISVDVLNSYANILNNLEKISYATYLLELTSQVFKQSNDSWIFEILKNGLNKINDGMDNNVIVDIIELKYLDYLGVRPNIDCCSLCGNTENIVTLDSSNGGFICQNCYTNQYIVKDVTIKLIRMLYYVDLNKITKISIKPENMKELNYFLDDYYERYTGLYLKSKKMLEKISKLVES
mgnify:FL=1